MKKIYILLVMGLVVLASCSKYEAEGMGLQTNDDTPSDNTPNNPTDNDSVKWSSVIDKALPIDAEMMAHPVIYWACTNGTQDSCKMEPWKLDINTEDMTVYRNEYQESRQSGITLDAQRETSKEVKDKLGNMVKRHSYTQPYKFNNFTHSISCAWTTGRVLYGNGKEESYLPEDGLYYELINVSGNTAADTTHFVRNDRIFAKETVKLTYKATLKVTAKNYTWRSWERTATVTVISFVDVVKHEETTIPTAQDYINNLEWHADRANRFYNGSQWCDGILFSSADKYYMLVATFTLNNDKTKEQLREIKMHSIAKSELGTPTKPFNAVMWDTNKNQPVPCLLSVDGDGWSLGTRYADGTAVTKRHGREEAVASGVKNLSESDNATPSPWIASTWSNAKYNGANFYTVTWHTTTHTLSRTVADEALKK
ncbi:MAG: hypothetical protein IJ545_07510 [Alphaproteobacteria bacterium]|nr:hypothetical protein [Alphaproteobacteria bacterium]